MQTRLYTSVLTMVVSALTACAPGPTDVELRAPSLVGAVVTIVGTNVRATVGADGVAHLAIMPRLQDVPITVTATLQGVQKSLLAACVPPIEPIGQPTLDHVLLLLQRNKVDGTCQLSLPEFSVGSNTYRGDYHPEFYDDLPCGPFAH